MNERIKELAERAWAYQITVYEDNGVRTYGEQEKEFSKQKFAELIIQECAVVAHNTAEGETTYGWMVGNKIKQHFGVEE